MARHVCRQVFSVHRRTGGLEKRQGVHQNCRIVHRRTGGLEIALNDGLSGLAVHRRTGGLEKCVTG